MSLYIKDLNIPKEGEWYNLIIKPDKEVIIDIISYKNNALLNTEYTQTIEIPTLHGDLIDRDIVRDECYKTMEELMQMTTINISAEALSLLCGFTIINNAPTVIESES